MTQHIPQTLNTQTHLKAQIGFREVIFLLFSLVLLVSCSRNSDTSQAGPGNQTVDANFKVHRDKDGSVTGEPGASPYEGRTGASPSPSASLSVSPSQ